MLTATRLRELLSYDPETGDFTRLVGRSGPRSRAGDVAGCENGQGYIRIYVDGIGYKAHRLAWLYVYGEMPPELDHINGNRSDNRIANLRSVTRAQNKMNCRTYKNCTSGLKGATFNKRAQKWKAQIQRDGKKVGLGYFETAEAAHEAYAVAANALHGEFARLS